MSGLTRYGFNTAYTRTGAGFAEDTEGTDYGRIRHVGAAAEFTAERRYADNANDITVLFAEEGHCSLFPCFIKRHFLYFHSNIFQNLFVHFFFNGPELVCRHRREMSEIEAEAFGFYQ